MSLVIDMKTRVVLHNSERDGEEPAPGIAPSDCSLRLATVEPDRMDVWRRWVPGLLPEWKDDGDEEP